MDDRNRTFPLFGEADDIHQGLEESEPRIPIQLSTGQRLAQARQELDLSIHEVARSLCMNENIIEALESSDYSGMPGIAYVTGYVRVYAELLNLDANQLINSDPGLGLQAIDKEFESKHERTTARVINRTSFSGGINWVATTVKGILSIMLVSALLISWNYWDEITEWWTDRIKAEKIIELERQSGSPPG